MQSMKKTAIKKIIDRLRAAHIFGKTWSLPRENKSSCNRAAMALACSMQLLMAPVAVLASTPPPTTTHQTTTTTASHSLTPPSMTSSTSIQAGAAVAPNVPSAASLLTPAVQAALATVVSPQQKSIDISTLAASTLSVTGNWTNTNSLLSFYSSNPNLHTVTISATGSIFNPVGAAISVSGLNLVMLAQTGIFNAGNISATSLAMSAPIVANVHPSSIGMTGSAPVMQAISDINIQSNVLLNQGAITSGLGNINISSLSNSLSINALAGSFNAPNGVINIGTQNLTDQLNIQILGGDFISQALNINTGSAGLLSMQANSISGLLNVTAFDASVGVNTGTLSLGSMQINGDPYIVDGAGDIVISADQDGIGLQGGPFYLFASGSIIYQSGSMNALNTAWDFEAGKGIYMSNAPFSNLGSLKASAANGPLLLPANITVANELVVYSNQGISLGTVTCEQLMAGSLGALTIGSINLTNQPLVGGYIDARGASVSIGSINGPINYFIALSSVGDVSVGPMQLGNANGTTAQFQGWALNGNVTTQSITSIGTSETYVQLYAPNGSINVNGAISAIPGNSLPTTVWMQAGRDIFCGSITANAVVPNTNGGTIMLTAGGTIASTASVLAISANGLGSGNGGTISLNLGNSASYNQSNLNISAQGANGGAVQIFTGGDLSVDSSVCNVNPYAGGNGNGGSISFVAVGNLTTTGNIQADGVGTGSGGSINLYSTGNYTVGNGGSQLFARGGTAGGNGGQISVTSGGDLTIAKDAVINVDVQGGNGNGGSITLTGGTYGAGVVTVNANLSANGAGSGSGGNISIQSQANGAGQGSVNVNGNLSANAGASGASGGYILMDLFGPGSTSVNPAINVNGNIYVKGGQTGTGGYVDIESYGTGYTVNIGAPGSTTPTTVNAQGGTTSGAGGTLYIYSDDAVALNSTILANAPVSGNGGTITVQAGQAGPGSPGGGVLAVGSNMNASAGAGATGTGSGGVITLLGQTITSTPATSMPISLHALGGTMSGDGGSITVTSSAGVSISGMTLDASARGTGSGGNITITAGNAAPGDLNLAANVLADAGTTGTGGTIQLTSLTGNVNITQNLSASETKIFARGGTTSGDGSQNVSITAANNLTASNAFIQVGARGSGNGGNVTLTAGNGGSGDLNFSGAVIADGEGKGYNGGNIDLTAGANVSLAAGIISASGPSGSSTSTTPVAVGNGGNININAQTLSSSADLLAQGGLTSGDGGTITINVTGQSSTFLNSGSINASAQGNGNGGQIAITCAGNLTAGADILANASQNGAGGQITISTSGTKLDTLSGLVKADGIKGAITIASGNNLSIPGEVGATALTKSGTSGTVTITANTLTVDGEVRAGKFGNPGTVTFNVTTLNATGTISAGKKGSLIATSGNSTNSLTLNLSGPVTGNWALDSSESIAVNFSGKTQDLFISHASASGDISIVSSDAAKSTLNLISGFRSGIESQQGDIHLQAATLNLNSSFGEITATNGSVEITQLSTKSNVSLGMLIDAGQKITIDAVGDIIQPGTLVFPLQASEIDLISRTGSIGSSSQPIVVEGPTSNGQPTPPQVTLSAINGDANLQAFGGVDVTNATALGTVFITNRNDVAAAISDITIDQIGGGSSPGPMNVVITNSVPDANIHINGNIIASKSADIETNVKGAGDILGSLFATVQAPTLTLVTGTGDIHGPNLFPTNILPISIIEHSSTQVDNVLEPLCLNINTSNLSVKTGLSGITNGVPVGGLVLLNNTGSNSILVNNASTGATFFLHSASKIDVGNGASVSSYGLVTLLTSSSLTVESNASITAGGSIIIDSGLTTTIGTDAKNSNVTIRSPLISIVGGNSVSFNGGNIDAVGSQSQSTGEIIVTVSGNPASSLQPAHSLNNFNVTGAVKWGPNQIAVGNKGPVNSATTIGSGTITFNSDNKDIFVGGGTNFSATAVSFKTVFPAGIQKGEINGSEVWTRTNCSITPVKDGIVLEKGTFHFMVKAPQRFFANGVQITAEKGSCVQIDVLKEAVIVRNIFDQKRGAVKVTYDGRVSALAPGEEIIFGNKSLAFVPYRGERYLAKNVLTREFSLPALVCNNSISNLMYKHDSTYRNHVLKIAASLLSISSSRGAYQSHEESLCTEL